MPWHSLIGLEYRGTSNVLKTWEFLELLNVSKDTCPLTGCKPLLGTISIRYLLSLLRTRTGKLLAELTLLVVKHLVLAA